MKQAGYIVLFWTTLFLFYLWTGSSSRNTHQIRTTPDEVSRNGFVMFARNDKLKEMVRSIKRLDALYNQAHDHPWYIFSREPLDSSITGELSRVSRGLARFGIIPNEHWGYTSTTERIIKSPISREKLLNRWFAGFMSSHPLLRDVDYVWKVDAESTYHCNMIRLDPFGLMKTNNLSYAGIPGTKEDAHGALSLWNNVQSFVKRNGSLLHSEGMELLSSDKGKSFNMCRFKDQFGILSLRFLRSTGYHSLFESVDDINNGFTTDGWTDSLFFTIASSLLGGPRSVHAFRDIGYEHSKWTYWCPKGKAHEGNHCMCDPTDFRLKDNKPECIALFDT
ncbi:alpha-1,2-mannosyltransferase [Planoprotostelium fungivorum]|uniref:Alpha-1,2-mannosyltransferase n=1 Tax=Planoprotostelium fungivorum TaxID=1890364 RepID=A0A2P6N1N2_9EUKA|nr:alpha-1,2-mannosyltransferase [Planoprotostelium fungivorum]